MAPLPFLELRSSFPSMAMASGQERGGGGVQRGGPGRQGLIQADGVQLLEEAVEGRGAGDRAVAVVGQAACEFLHLPVAGVSGHDGAGGHGQQPAAAVAASLAAAGVRHRCQGFQESRRDLGERFVVELGECRVALDEGFEG